MELVGMLAACALEAPAGWKPGDTVAAPIEELRIGGFVIADGGTVVMATAQSIRILLLVPLAETDYARVRGGGAEAWLARNPPTESAWDTFAARD